MLLRLMNWMVGWFGYEWVQVPWPENEPEPFRPDTERENWDELYRSAPRYVLRKKTRQGGGNA